MQLAHLVPQLFNAPLMLRNNQTELLMSALSARIRQGVRPLAAADEDYGAPVRGAATDKGYVLLAGVAIIKVHGVLLQRLGWMAAYADYLSCGGYDAIRMGFLNAVSDEAVRAIVFDIDSGGGVVSGCFDLVDQISAQRGSKPIWAILNEKAFSAAYAIASACDHIVVPRTGETGSIGVIAMFVDYSEMLSKAGIKPTLFVSGARKPDSYGEAPLSEEAAALFQADVDVLGDLFIETTAKNRGLTAAKVRGFQAGTFLGAAGVTSGLADAVLAPDAAFRALLAELG